MAQTSDTAQTSQFSNATKKLILASDLWLHLLQAKVNRLQIIWPHLHLLSIVVNAIPLCKFPSSYLAGTVELANLPITGLIRFAGFVKQLEPPHLLEPV